MSSYLLLAERVLRTVGRPLSSRQILASAFSLGIVPEHLHGKTLHKTLQARLSEDILKGKQFSKFYRTGPGRFFIRSDGTSDKGEYPEVKARRRALELRYKDVLSIRCDESDSEGDIESIGQFMSRASARIFYQNYRKAAPGSLVVWACAIIKKSNCLFSYRRGSYREDRDEFLNQRSIALYSPVVRSDVDLFSSWDEGLTNAVVEITTLDLDVPLELGWLEESVVQDKGLLLERDKGRVPAALGVVEVSVPVWFEVPRRRLSINDMRWIEPWSINDLSEYDPWSRMLLERLYLGA